MRPGRAWLGTPAVLAVIAVTSALAPASGQAAQVTQDMRVRMSDGTTLQGALTGQAPLLARPVLVEFSPYGPGSMTTNDGPDFNYLLVQIRGTGDSDGQFDALGNRTQSDVAQTLQWACHQSWSNGNLGLNGFSASAITVYNSLHSKLPCVRTAVLKSGTFELYRDLLWPGGVSNFIPGAGVLALIGAPATGEGPARLERSPISSFDTAVGLIDTGLNGGFLHPTLDSFWRERRFRGDVNHLPILMIDSFFDVESRGAFQAYQALKGDGAHLMVVAGHDGSPAGTDGGVSATKDWFEHYLRGAGNGVQRPPRVQMLLSEGSREAYLAGKFVRYQARDWPVPGEHWDTLWLDAARSGSGGSINDGSLDRAAPKTTTTQSYAAIPTEPTMTDQPNDAIIGPNGINQAAGAFPLLSETTLGEPQALTYTTPPLVSDLLSAGPAALDLRLSTTTTETAIWTVISDVWPDGSSHPVATGRLLSSYPNVVAAQSLKDPHGNIVEPYGDYSQKTDAAPRSERSYQIEFWPIGNRFQKGHRIRLVILGASAASSPSLPALNSVRVGGVDGSRLLLPMLPTPISRAVRTGCPRATGALAGARLGSVRLGMTRGGARRAFAHSSARGHRYMDFFCLTPNGIRVGYASHRLEQGLSPSQWRRVRERVVIATTANRYYTLDGVRPGARLAAVRARLHLGAAFHVGLNYWYLTPGRQVRGVVKVRHGRIEEIGIADGRLTPSRAATLRFLESFS